MKTKEWLLYNSVVTWLHHYADSGSELIDQYKLLEEELKQVYEQSINTETQQSRRPKKQQRTKKTKSNPSSTEENKATNQES
jgi:hypothetical protein